MPREVFSESNNTQIKYFSQNKITHLIHLASAGVVDSKCSFFNNVDFNIFESHRLIASAIKSGCSNVIVTGTCFEYGLTGNSNLFLDVHDELQPVGYHAISKAVSFHQFERKYSSEKVNFSYLRLFQVYGKHEHQSRLYPSLVSAAKSNLDFPMSSGVQIRDFIHIDKVCDAIYNAQRNDNGWEVHNICSGIPRTVYEFAEEQWQKLEAKGKLLPGKISHKQSALHRIVGKPSTLLSDKLF